MESLVGDIGGYMGLFLGYALVNFSKVVVVFFQSTKRTLVSWKASNGGNSNSKAKGKGLCNNKISLPLYYISEINSDYI